MPNAVRFLFTGPALQKVIASSMQVEDVEPGGPATDPPAGSMRLRFRQTDPAGASICPLLPGAMQFLVDATAPGVIPDPATGPFSAADVGSWKTRGYLLVTVADATADEIERFAPQLPVKPNRIWYGPVQLPPDFFFQTLTVGLRKATIPTANGAVRTTAADWPQHAIAAFLAGTYAPVLASAADAAQDDRVRFVMPTVVVGAAGEVELTITAARAQKPQDALDDKFDEPVAIPPIARSDPRHPRNGLLPAREVYRQMRLSMVADAAAVPVMDAMLADWPDAPRFFPIHVTRTSELVPNCSAFFPRQTVNLRTAPAVVRQDRLPAHGVVYVRQAPPAIGQPVPPAPLVELWLTGTMKWLPGGGTSWRDPGQTVPVPIDLAANPRPHISARLPMSEAMLSDATRDVGCGLCCTYMSLRRTMRALVDNRIAGGRLNFGVSVTSAITRGLIHRAWQGTPASAGTVADNQPPVAAGVNADVEAPKLIPVLQALFPGDAPQFPVAGAAANPIIFSRGRMLHDLWQSRLDTFNSPRERANFSDDLIGRGGPGAAVAMGIATFHVDPIRQGGETDRDYAVRVTDETLVGLQPGAVLQFWLSEEAYEDMKARLPDPGVFGHSPVFVAYIGPDGAHTGVRIIDQNGNSSRTVETEPAGVWPILGGDQIWISANWTE